MNTVKPLDDPHYKATLSLALHGARLQFHVAQDLFSSAGLDPGTGVLLRSLSGPEHAGATTILDLGCGYGPLGLFLKAWRPGRTVHMVDRDRLAVRFATLNAADNDLDGVEVYPSLGYDDIANVGGFDLIVSNIPAKAGPTAIRSLLLDGVHFLSPDGLMAVVVISRLAADVRSVLDEAGALVEFERENRGYSCFHFRYGREVAGSYENGFERGIYDRGVLRWKGTDVQTVFGLPDLDTPGFPSQLALKVLGGRRTAGAVVHNPAQGLVPAALAGSGVPVAVADRDLLALRNSARNATLSGVSEPATQVVLLRPRESVSVTLATLQEHPGANTLIAGTSTQVTRVIDSFGKRIDVVQRERKSGFSAALVTY